MNHSPSDYINAGYRYEKAKSPDDARAHAQRIRSMLTSESIHDQTEARDLIERGRQEARLTQ